MTKETIETLKDVYSTLDYIENELTYQLAFNSGKLDKACLYAREAMNKLQIVLPTETAEGENMKYSTMDHELPVYLPTIDSIHDYGCIRKMIEFIKSHDTYEIENELCGWMDVTREHYFAEGYRKAVAEIMCAAKGMEEHIYEREIDCIVDTAEKDVPF